MVSQRYNRIIRLPDIGEENFARLSRARIALVGCGTLGGAFGLNLARIGVEFLRLIDRDFVEEHNLSGQLFFDEEDVRQILPKAVAAQRHLEKINSACRIEARVDDLTGANAELLLADVDLILDATDNFEARFILNDAAIKQGIPWIYCGAVGYGGAALAIHPGKTACLRCLIDRPPEPTELPTCETEGVWPPAAQSIAAVALTEAARILTGRDPSGRLWELDLKTLQWKGIPVQRKKDCPACIRGEFAHLSGDPGLKAVKMCGRDMVHLHPSQTRQMDLTALARKLQATGETKVNEYLMWLRTPEAEFFLFKDGRAFVKGVADPARARALFHRYIGP